jgi:phi13 family phage major tail protein
MPKPTIITGIKKVYYALLTTDDVASLIYGTPVYLKGIQELGVKPKTNKDPLYAEDILYDQTVTFDSADVSMLLASLTSAERAVLLGQTTAAAGGVYARQEDEAPYVALLYKAAIRDGYRYGVFYKGAFALFDETMRTKEGKTAFSAPSLAATFQPTIWEDADGKHIWEYHVDTTDPNCPADIDSTWFAAVTVPTADITPPTVTVVPADAATGVAKTANIVWTFNEAIDPSKVTAANFILMENDGTIIPGALTLDGTGKIVTLDPTAALDGTTEYIAICTTNVTDLAGNRLAAASVANFTTTA